MKKVTFFPLRIKYVAMVFFAYLIVGQIHAQNLDFLWVKKITSLNHNSAQHVALDDVGNVYVSGAYRSSADFDPSAGSSLLTSNGQSDIYISKFTPNGDLLWAISLGDTANNTVNSMAVDKNGNVLVLTPIRGTIDFDPSANTVNLTATNYNLAFCKYDSSGNLVWAKLIEGTNEVVGYSIKTDDLGNVYVGGYYSGDTDFDPSSSSTILSSGTKNIGFIAKYSAMGNFLFVKQFESKGISLVTNLDIDTQGNIYFVGTVSDSTDFDPGVGTHYLLPETVLGGKNIFISKLNSSGSFVWAKLYLGGDDTPFSLTVDDSSNVVLSGIVNGKTDFDPSLDTFYISSIGTSSVFVNFISKLSSNGDFRWAKKSDVRMFYVTTDDSCNVYATGDFIDTADFSLGSGQAITYARNQSGYMLKLDHSSAFKWVQQLSGSGLCFAKGLAITDDKFMYTVGNFARTVDFDPSGAFFNISGNNFSSSFIHKMNLDNRIGLNENTIEANFFAYPNPTTNKLTIELDKQYTDVTVSVRNIVGQLVSVKKFNETESLTINIKGPSGYYMIEVETEEGISKPFKILKQ